MSYQILLSSKLILKDKSNWTLVLKGPATPASGSTAASLALSVLFPFAPGPFGLDPFAPIAAAAPVPSAAAITAATIVSPFISLIPTPAIAALTVAAALAILAPIAPAAPLAFAPAIASIFASRPLDKRVPLGLS
ncbi:hypothetical protein B2J93_239 [Marssonina coronariae]|uniref:Uncharacterized protein n=1 Tax=Diplocarpon coronariae TaxID=2795749 RepID=A0A218Z052_9HELO|nr:hypothetical protein B2J93_239 [Marssonina coronariae]